MPRSASTAVENNFVNGWITEATGLNFPENAVTDSSNYVFTKTGKTDRRLGIDLEAGNTPTSVFDDVSNIYTEYLWESVGGDGNLSFHVQQIGGSLLFFRVGETSQLSANLAHTLNFEHFSKTDVTTFKQHAYQFSSGLGRLFIAHPFMDPIYLSYDEGVLNTHEIVIQTRDVIGLPGLPVPRLSTISPEHRYDLLNQGWDNSKIERMFDMAGFYPSDFDVWWLYKTPDAFGTEVFLTDVAVSAGILDQIGRGNSPAPKGSYILREFFQDRSTVSSVSGIPVVTSGVNRPSAIAFFAGRVFYAGVTAQNFNTKVYFSQILESVDQAGLCYQQNDPTSQYASDLLPTDGGTIAIPDIGGVIRLWVIEGSLLVFCTNGIWQITGSQGIGFSANDYTVKKVSNLEILSSLSFVNVLGNPVWWSQDGIYSVSTDSVGAISVQSLTEDKIKSYYRALPGTSKKYAKGAFNLSEKIIQWIYNPEGVGSIGTQQDYTEFLNFDLNTKAFYRFTIPNEFTTIKGVVDIRGTGSSSELEDVVDNLGVLVTTAAGTVTSRTATSTPLTSTLKYATTYNPDRTFFSYSEIYRTDWMDWVDVVEAGGGTDAAAYFTSGYRIRGEVQRKFQSNYIVLVNDASEPSSYLFRGQWDFARSDNFLRSSVPQLIENINPTINYSFRRIKVRGHGKALQYRVDSVPGKATAIVGWSSWDTTNGSL